LVQQQKTTTTVFPFSKAQSSKMAEMTPEEKFNLIVRNLEEHYGDDFIMKILQERDLKLYWGTAPTGAPHCGMLNCSKRQANAQDTLYP